MTDYGYFSLEFCRLRSPLDYILLFYAPSDYGQDEKRKDKFGRLFSRRTHIAMVCGRLVIYRVEYQHRTFYRYDRQRLCLWDLCRYI